MQGTTIQRPQTTFPGATPVWDLTTATQRRYVPRARPSRTGPIAAAFGAAALAVALVPGAAAETRLFFAIASGLVAAVVGFSALRRRQTSTAMVLAALGVAAPIIAVTGIVLQMANAPAAVTSSTVQRATLEPNSSALIPTPGFKALADGQRDEMSNFLAATVLQLQTMHGPSAPLPTSLRVSNGALVEGDGLFRGASLGAVPQDARLTYQVSSDGTAFRLEVSAADDDHATIWADRALQLSTLG